MTFLQIKLLIMILGALSIIAGAATYFQSKSMKQESEQARFVEDVRRYQQQEGAQQVFRLKDSAKRLPK